MKHTSYIEIDSKAYKKNLAFLKNEIGDSVKFVSVIKGNAYGHGIKEFLPLAEKNGVDYFAVFNSHEAEKALDVKNEETRLMILGDIPKNCLEWAIVNKISFYVFSLERLFQAILASKKAGKKAYIHLELETGLNRTGLCSKELIKAVDIIKRNEESIFIEGICTHYAGAESVSNYYRISKQKERFSNMIKCLKEKGITAKYNHSACSAAVLNYPETISNMVRVGIAQYGFWPSNETRMFKILSRKTDYTEDPLDQVLSWKTYVMDKKSVKKGQFVSYGNSYMAQNNMLIASIPVGYSNGYSRALSNRSEVLIGGQKARVIGTINMNMFLVDITNIPEVHLGDEVVLIGKQGNEKITVTSFTEVSNYLNYELLTRLPANIPRYIV